MSLIKINKGTQRAQNIIRAWLRSDEYSLWDAYERCSSAKESAYQYCLDLERSMNGEQGCITGHNTCTFSYAFKRGNDLIYITHCGDYIIPDALAD